LACGTYNGEVKVWDTINWQLLLRIKAHKGEVMRVIWSLDNNYIVSAGDKIIRSFSSEIGYEVRKFIGHVADIYYLSWLDGGTKLLSTSEHEGTFRIWDFKSGVQLKSVYLKNIYCIAIGDDQGNIIFTGHSDAEVAYYRYSDIWETFDEYKKIHFLYNYLTNTNEIADLNTDWVQNLLNTDFCGNISVFHIFADKQMAKELGIFLEFCLKNKIYPKRFFDTEKKPLLESFLNANFPSTLIDSFLEYVILSEVDLGNLFILTGENLCSLTKINSFRTCQLLENRFRVIKHKFCQFAFFLNVERSIGVVDCLDNFKLRDLNNGFSGVKVLPLQYESTETPFIMMTDIPLKEFSSQFLQEITKSSAFDDFCKSNVMTSFLDLMWLSDGGARRSFLKGNFIYLMYFVLIIVNSLYILPNFVSQRENSEDNDYWVYFLICSLCLAMILCRMFWKEFIQWKSSKSEYFNSIWNWIDVTNITLSFVSFFINILTIFEVMNDYETIRLLHSLCFFMSMIRIFDFLRSFKETCFLIQIITQVLKDMKIFFLVMIVLLSNFSCSGSLLIIPFFVIKTFN